MAHPVRRFTKRLIIFCNLIIALFFLLGCYGNWFDPATFWFTGFFTLTSFYFLLVLIVFMFFWLVAKPVYSLISILTMLLAWTPMRELIKFRVTNDFTIAKEKTSI